MEGLLCFFVQQILSCCFIYLIHFPSKPFPNRVPFRCPCAGTSVWSSVGCSGVGAMPGLPRGLRAGSSCHQHCITRTVVALPVRGATHGVCDFCNRDKAAASQRVSKTHLWMPALSLTTFPASRLVLPGPALLPDAAAGPPPAPGRAPSPICAPSAQALPCAMGGPGLLPPTPICWHGQNHDGRARS